MNSFDWEAVYDVLVSCGASTEPVDRLYFMQWALDGCPGGEWRFMGSLGWGGKLYVNDFNMYVSCYPEDETPARLDMILLADERLEALVGG